MEIQVLKNIHSQIKGRTCNPTPLVHQDMKKKTTFYEKSKER